MPPASRCWTGPAGGWAGCSGCCTSRSRSPCSSRSLRACTRAWPRTGTVDPPPRPWSRPGWVASTTAARPPSSPSPPTSPTASPSASCSGPADMRPIQDYGLLGDTRTAALAGPDGSIDWLCLPHFDGDPVFARLVAGPNGGHFTVGPAGHAEMTARSYRPGSTTLETAWQAGSGRLVLTEGMVSQVGG